MKYITLTQNKQAMVDDENYEELNKYSWSLSGGGKYAVRHKRVDLGLYTIVRMHREILVAPRERVVDHINGNTLDNRKSNLRLCNSQQNSFNRGKQSNNTSGYKGVYHHNKKNLLKSWYAKVYKDGRYHCKGMFATPAEAAKAYNFLANEHFGEFARLNDV